MNAPAAWLCSHDTPLAGLRVIERRRHSDERGFFGRLFCADELAPAGFDAPVAQVNQSVTRERGAVRGLHFQHAPHAEVKLVSCLRGEVFDVAVDLRRGSRTFLKWHAQRLSPGNGLSLLIPRGFAHGFQTLSDDCEMLYLHSAPYAPAAEGGVAPGDPALAIDWPLPVARLSPRDAAHPPLPPDFTGLTDTAR
jgi:dTDP-4-dehydrorhamnose 3,5-epimerase